MPRPRPSEGRGRRFESPRVRHRHQALSDNFRREQTRTNSLRIGYRVTVVTRAGSKTDETAARFGEEFPT